LVYSVFGQVVGVRKFVNGDIEIDFFHGDDEITEFRYSKDNERSDNFPKELAETLAGCLKSDVCVEIYFEDNGKVGYIELEECEDDESD